MAQSGAIAKDAFNGCTNESFTTIEFDFTTASGKNLGDDNLGESDTSAVTALANIYKMFAASENNFSNNGDGGLGTPTKTNF